MTDNNESKLIDITVNEIKVNNLESKLDGLLIAQISDLHINKWNIELIEHSIELLNKLSPDIVTMTGDAICSGKKYIPDLISLFKNIKSNCGNFACLGNHDHSDGDDSLRVQDAYKKADFRPLVNESVEIGDNLVIAGADDLDLGDQNIQKMMKNIKEGLTSVFLTHNPNNFEDFAKFNPNLVLSGHTHGAQIYTPLLDFLYKHILDIKYIAGLYEKDSSSLYVNRGIGTALLSPVLFNKKILIKTPRINAKPEISLFVLKKKI